MLQHHAPCHEPDLKAQPHPNRAGRALDAHALHASDADEHEDDVDEMMRLEAALQAARLQSPHAQRTHARTDALGDAVSAPTDPAGAIDWATRLQAGLRAHGSNHADGSVPVEAPVALEATVLPGPQRPVRWEAQALEHFDVPPMRESTG